MTVSLTWSSTTGLNQLFKRSTETRQFTMDFSQEPEIVAGAILSGAPAVTANAITAGAAPLTLSSVGLSSSDKQIQVAIAGGTPGTLYQVVFTCPTNVGGAVLTGIGYLTIDDQ